MKEKPKLKVETKKEEVDEKETNPETEPEIENLDSHTLAFIQGGHIDIPDMANFEPTQSLAEIKEFTKRLSKENLSSARAALIKKFREKLKIFRENMAQAQGAMEALINENPDRNQRELEEELRQILDYFNLQSQKDVFFEVLKKYLKAHSAARKIVAYYKEKVKKNWESMLFKRLFGRFPEGKVEVTEMPMNLFFKIYNETDYALACLQHEPDEEELKESRSSLGVRLNREVSIKGLDVLLGNNSKGTLDTEAESEEDFLKIHEEEHAIHHGLFPTSAMVRAERDVFLAGSIDERTFVEKIKKLSHNNINMWQTYSKGEILSYFKEGQSLTVIKIKLLSPDDLYHYITVWESGQNFIRTVAEHVKKMGVLIRNVNGELLTEKEVEKVARTVIYEAWELYKKNLVRALDAVWYLVQKYKDDPEGHIKVLRLISQEPLDKWVRLSKLISQ